MAPSLRLQIVEASGAPVHSLALFVSADGGEAEPGEHHAVDAVFTIEVAVHGSYFVWPAEPMAQLLDPSLGIDARVSTHAAGPAQLVLLRPAPPTACRSCSRSASVTTSRVR